MALALVDRIGRGSATGAPVRRCTVTVAGEVDASNAREFADAICALGFGCAQLTLDLTDVTFMGVDGIAALHAIRAHLMRTDTPWELVPSTAVTRVLQLGDPAGVIQRSGASARSSRPRLDSRGVA